MTLDSIEAEPKRKETRLKLKNPINPQLIAPIMAMVRAITFIVFCIFYHPFLYADFSVLLIIVRRVKKYTDLSGNF